jgi:hypothetical protein
MDKKKREKLRERFLRDPLPAAWADLPPHLGVFHLLPENLLIQT